ncbi:DUF2510 domain-containing protein [Granulicoccus sp. GXG6511]|uniref:DUF2510 domain-containing protein n=1 Tax=Granulicoccus sp. GXG6511 TaxID=3381351 RepID=UPI003D7CE041
MQQPGWYTDPSGEPGRFRFWNGHAWTTATTSHPRTPWPMPSGPPPSGPTGRPTPAPPGPARPRAGVIVAVAAALVLVLIGVGGFLVTTRNAAPQTAETPRPRTMQPVPPSGGGATNAPTMPPGEEAELDCSGGNAVFNRRSQPQPQSTGVVYDAVPEWTFSFDPGYWTWMDDHVSLGAIRLDGADNEAGITLGGIRFENGFADQSTAGALTAACLEGTLSVDEPTRAGAPTTTRTTLGGMPTFHTRVEYTGASAPAPLVVDIYVIDAEQGNKWAQLITFQRPGSEAGPLIDRAVASVRHS